MLARALPKHLAAPAQGAAGELSGEAVHHEPRHLQLPSMHQGPGVAVTRRALELADLRIPVVAQLIDEPDAKPYRIGEVDCSHAPRMRGMVVDAVGGKGERPVRKALPAPAAIGGAVATSRRRIFGVEFRRHESKDRGRQPGFERPAGTLHDKDVVALLDARRRKPNL